MNPRDFRLDERSGVPVYLQLRDQILAAIARGALTQGDQLPTVRELAVELAVNPNTVNRAYAELERDGVLRSQRGRGTFVTGAASADLAPQRERIQRAAERFVAFARTLGFSPEEIHDIVASETTRQR
ncbi:MAG: GntR family transcriptional regulator [bacterium]|nr:GntR family transcriptional regulator [bacterium]